MGIGRDYREKILEDEHRKYFNNIQNKSVRDRLESEERFLRLYENRKRQDISAFLVVMVMLLSIVGFTAYIIAKLFGALFT